MLGVRGRVGANHPQHVDGRLCLWHRGQLQLWHGKRTSAGSRGLRHLPMRSDLHAGSLHSERHVLGDLHLLRHLHHVCSAGICLRWQTAPGARPVGDRVWMTGQQMAEGAAFLGALAAIEEGEADARLAEGNVGILIEHRVRVRRDLVELASTHAVRHRIRVVGGNVAISAPVAMLAASDVEIAKAERRPRVCRGARRSATAIAKLLLMQRLQLRDLSA